MIQHGGEWGNRVNQIGRELGNRLCTHILDELCNYGNCSLIATALLLILT